MSGAYASNAPCAYPTLLPPPVWGGSDLRSRLIYTRSLSEVAGRELLWVQPAALKKPVIRFKGRQGFMKAKGQVEVTPEAAGRPDLAFLILLGWYLILLHAEDAAASTAAVTVVSTS